MSTKKTLVLGSGISALAYLYLNKHAKALAGLPKGRGGMFKNQKHLGPQYLWVDKYTDEFLKMLRLPRTTQTISVGVFHGKKLYNPSDPMDTILTAQIAIEYALKTRGTPAQSSFMSSGQREYKVYTVPMETIVDTLLHKVGSRLIPAAAIDILTESNFVQDSYGDMWSYEQLTSTIPATEFTRMAGLDGQYLKALDKTYGTAPLTSCKQLIKQAYSLGLHYVYFPGEYEPWHRVTFIKSPKMPLAVFEFTDIRSDSFKGVVLGSFFDSYITQRGGQIVDGKERLREDKPKNVKFLGRYAQWDHSVKFNDVLKQILFEGVGK